MSEEEYELYFDKDLKRDDFLEDGGERMKLIDADKFLAYLIFFQAHRWIDLW